jgi:hypothetical protein
VRAIAQWVLLAAVIVAASVKSYSLYTTTLDDREMMPAVIASGEARAPNQYRVLVPLLWTFATANGVPAPAAERLLVVLSILFCYAALAVTLHRASRSIPITALCLLAFYGAAASGFWFRYRDTFFDVAFTCLGMALVLQRRPSWAAYALLSAVAALNRETWSFSLVAAASSRWAYHRGGAGDSGRRDAIGLLCATAITVGVLVAIRTHYGVRDYHYAMWQYTANLPLLLVAGPASIGQAVWLAGSGVFVVWLIFALASIARHVPFVIGFAAPLLAVSFFISNWAETRIFIPCYAVMIVSIASGLGPSIGRLPESGPVLDRAT